MVISYKISGLSWQLMKRMGYLPWVGLPNILLRDFVVPERLQHDATPDQLSRDVLDWLDHPAKAAAGSTLYRTSSRSAAQHRAGCHRCHRPSHREPKQRWPSLEQLDLLFRPVTGLIAGWMKAGGAFGWACCCRGCHLG